MEVVPLGAEPEEEADVADYPNNANKDLENQEHKVSAKEMVETVHNDIKNSSETGLLAQYLKTQNCLCLT